MILAQGGASSDAPSNSSSACLLALMQGADGLLLDVRRTSDGVLVSYPAEQPNRLVKKLRRIETTSFASLEQFDLGRAAGAAWRGHHIPRLEDHLRQFAGSTRILLDLHGGTEMTAEVAGLLSDLQLTTGQVELASSSLELLAGLRTQLPEVPQYWVYRPAEVPNDVTSAEWFGPESIVSLVAGTGTEGVWIDAATALESPELIAQLHEVNLKVMVGSVNRVPRALRLRELGVDGLITTYPGRLQGRLSEAAAAEAALVAVGA